MAIIKSGVYYIQNAGTGTVIDLDNGNSTDGTKVQGYQKHELSNSLVSVQLWIVSQLGNDPVYSIQNTRSQTYLTSESSANGTPITGCAGTSNSNQQWNIYRRNNADTGYVIRNKATTTYVDLKDGNRANGTLVQNQDGSNTTNLNDQLWEFVLA